MNTKQDLLSKIDIVELISEYVDLSKSGSNYKGLSPFKEENTPSFVVSPTKKIFKDFSSQLGGDAIKFYSLINNISYQEAMYKLASRYGVDLPNNTKVFDKNKKYYDTLKEVVKHFTDNLKKSNEAMQYLKNRDYDANDIEMFKLGYANDSFNDLLNKFDNEILLELGLISTKDGINFYDTFVNRIILPIMNSNGDIIAFGGRDITNSEKSVKYINSKESKIFIKSNELFGLYDKGYKIKEFNNVILVEGFFDVLRLHKNGIVNTIGSLGTALTESQAKKISKWTKNIVIAYDDDSAGTNAKIRAINILNKYGFNIKIMSLNGLAKDPDEFIQKYGKNKFIDEFKKSVDAFEYLYNIYSEGFDVNKQAAKMELITKLREYFNTISNRMYFENAVNKLALKLSVSNDVIKSFIKYNEWIVTDDKKNTVIKNEKEKYDKDEELEKFTMFLLYHCKEERVNYTNFIFSEENKTLFQKLLKSDFDEDELNDYEAKVFFDSITKLDKSIVNNNLKHNIYAYWVEKYIKNSLEEIIAFYYDGNYNEMNSIEYTEYINYIKSLKSLKAIKNISEIKKIFIKYLEYEKNETLK